jgi:hypothetical protein
VRQLVHASGLCFPCPSQKLSVAFEFFYFCYTILMIHIMYELVPSSAALFFHNLLPLTSTIGSGSKVLGTSVSRLLFRDFFFATSVSRPLLLTSVSRLLRLNSTSNFATKFYYQVLLLNSVNKIHYKILLVITAQ